ncbi:hypothetical protein [Glycomyces sp. NPDC021274]|uniref:hypothetical protein n=1 Tax=Glycomyces sp. NPDC021274 TaxID=3155120 RepID=UPI0033F1EE04
MRPRRRAHWKTDPPSPTSLAGWLFADLALLLFIITVVIAADFPAAEADPPEAAPPTSAAASESPSPNPSPTADPGVESEPHVFYVDTDAAGLVSGDAAAEAGLVDALRADFDALTAQGYTVGFALTFGGADDPGYGGDIAEAANAVMATTFTDLFGDAPTRHFWTSSNKEGVDVGTVQIELYLLAA